MMRVQNAFAYLLLLLLLPWLLSCRRQEENHTSSGPALSATEYTLLPDDRKLRYKDVIIRVPQSWGGALLPLDAGPYPTPVEKAIHGGDLRDLMGIYNQSVFELEHPRVKVEYINFDMWTDNFRAALAVALSARRAPAYYIARD